MLYWTGIDQSMQMEETPRVQDKKPTGNNDQVCDEDYTGEYIVALHNDSNLVQTVKHGDRIAQLVFMPYLAIDFEEVEELEKTDRGSNGFGSTGK